MDALLQPIVNRDTLTELVRLGYLLSSIQLFGPSGMWGTSNMSERLRSSTEATFHRPFAEVVGRWSEVHHHIIAQAAEVRIPL